MTKPQLEAVFHKLIEEGVRYNKAATPGDPLFPIHMTAALILSSLASATLAALAVPPSHTEPPNDDAGQPV